MNAKILSRLSEITEEEKKILAGQERIDRGLYMDGSRDVISGAKLLSPGKNITIRPHTRFIAFPEHTHDYAGMKSSSAPGIFCFLDSTQGRKSKLQGNGILPSTLSYALLFSPEPCPIWEKKKHRSGTSLSPA